MSSSYNSGIKTNIIDPVFDRSNFRSEYRLNADSVYLSNMRLVNMGIGDNGAPSNLNPLLGCFCIDTIQLLDGNQLLDQVLDASILQGFRNYNKKNDENISVENDLIKNNMGFVMDGETEWNDSSVPYKVKQNSLKISMENGPDDTGSDLQNTVWLNLKSLLPFLSSSLIVPGDVFKNLRLVINWKSPQQLKNLVKLQGGTYNTLTETALIVDELLPSDARTVAMKNYRGVVYKPIEADKVNMPEVTPSIDSTKLQENRFLINGFNNKTVERLLLVQTPTDENTWTNSGNLLGAGNQGSTSQLNKSVQIRVNGANKIPRTGITNKNQALRKLTETWGECNLPTGGNFVYVPDLVNNNTSGSDETRNLMGQLDYTGCEVREMVRELVIEFNRVGVHNNDKLNQRLELNIFGEVTKSVSVDTNTKKYVVSYI